MWSRCFADAYAVYLGVIWAQAPAGSGRVDVTNGILVEELGMKQMWEKRNRVTLKLKNVLAVMLAVVLSVGLLPGTVMTVRADDFIFVGTEKASIATGGGGTNWSYNADSNTLTLSGVDISSGSAESGY